MRRSPERRSEPKLEDSEKLEEVEFDIGDGQKEIVLCETVDLNDEEYNKSFKDAGWYKKSVEVKARKAEQKEEVITELDATKNVAEVGDWIVTNPRGEQYIIKPEKFAQLYQESEEEPGTFISKGVPVRAIKNKKNITFIAPWGEKQSVKSGGYIIDSNGERYGISGEIFSETYKETEKPKEKGENG